MSKINKRVVDVNGNVLKCGDSVVCISKTTEYGFTTAIDNTIGKVFRITGFSKLVNCGMYGVELDCHPFRHNYCEVINSRGFRFLKIVE